MFSFSLTSRNFLISSFISSENFPNLEKTVPVQVQEASRTLSRSDQNRTSPRHIIIKTTNTETRERILKAVREKTKNIQR
jgi:hypothetical protein